MRVRIDLTMNAAKNLRQDGVCWEDTGRTTRSPFVTAWQELTQVFGRSSRSGTHSPRFSGKKWRRSASNLCSVAFSDLTTPMLSDFHGVNGLSIQVVPTRAL